MTKIAGIELIDQKYLQIDINQHPELAKPILDKLNASEPIEIDEDYFKEQWEKGISHDIFWDEIKTHLKNKLEVKEIVK